MTNLSRGSKWRKWDLHVHTPESYGFSGTWEEFKTQLQNADCAVIGINDYFSVAGYKKIKKEIENDTLNIGDKIILPVVEMRMTDSLQNRNTDTNGTTHFNFHIIFSNKLNIDDIESFIKSLKSGDSIIGSDYNDKTKLKDKKVSFKETIKNLQSDKKFQDNFLIWLPYDEYGGIGEINPDSDGWIKEDFIKKSNILGSSNQNQIDFFLWKSVKTDGSPKFTQEQFEKWFEYKKPCIKGSDSHSQDYPIGKLKDKDSNSVEKFCWIKANPTFEGLKQIVYEPRDRVKIQTSKPEEKVGYQAIDRIEIANEKIFNTSIDLNQNLNCIIGGRSTGKSLLLAALAKKLKIENPPEFHNQEYENYIDEISRNLKVFWKDGKEDDDREVEYFKQGYMYDLAMDESKLSKLIQNILRKKGKDEILDNYSSLINKNKKFLSSSVDNFFQILEEIELKENSVADKGDKKGIQDEISKLEAEIKKLNTKKITKEETVEYQKNKLIIEKGNEKIIILQRDIQNIEKLKNLNLIQNNIEYELTSVSDINKNIITEKFKELKATFKKEWDKEIDDLKQKIETREKEYEKNIKEAKENEIYIKISKIYNQSEHLKEIEEKIKKEKVKLLDITTLLEQLKKLKDQKNQLEKSIKILYGNYLLEIEKLIPLLSASVEGLEIKAKKVFKKSECKEFLESAMNKAFSTNQKYLYSSDILEKEMFSIFDDLIVNKLELKAGYTNKTLSNRLLSENFYKIEYDLIYENDDFQKMSDGKKSFVVLKLLLDFSDKDCPILIDQPEDDLDNRAIYTELVKYLKAKKKVRQIIVATHNSNVVVGADSELIIVANQNGIKSKNKNEKKFQYSSGSLEYSFPKNKSIITTLDSQGTREHICEILEGGKIAFEQRKKKYNF